LPAYGVASFRRRASGHCVTGRFSENRATRLLPVRLRPGATRGECSGGGASCVYEPA
jgi:hypothetical protein